MREAPSDGGVTPVLWLCGPSGVGKTTVAWQLYSQLVRDGVEAGYVDIDQLGICCPEPTADPGRHRLKAENLGAVVTAFRAAGARCVIVSGVVDPSRGVYAELLPRTALTVWRLRADRKELRRRFLNRGSRVEEVAEVLEEAEALDTSGFADGCIDTTGHTATAVVRLLREHLGPWPTLPEADAAHEPSGAAGPRSSPGTSTLRGVSGLRSTGRRPGTHRTAADERVLWLCGATGVGKSTIGFPLHLRALHAGFPSAYIDLDQLGFCAPASADDPSRHRVKARVLAAVWRNHREAGARRLVMVGSVENQSAIDRYAEALPATATTVCRLHAGEEELTRRVVLRGQGGSWPQPGDPLKGRPTAHLLRIASEATADANAMERAGLGDLKVVTDGLTVEESVDAVCARTGWPGPDPTA
ncbi:AAA family ATPase [Streptomyces sp. TRM43335]|uniref:AAA family ATPase n=1 Tax=Streptomyces taklimakanensis TaxID=2569853 RepID=A0A6G2B6W0_9ACTN|nr:AAA family ATPase [Streptomyces taklimakanensis]MTE17642.1 AAA family ATPase [Streptomyces taklimakanensis]